MILKKFLILVVAIVSTSFVYADVPALVPLHYRDPTAIDIVIIGDGFSDIQQDFFEEKADEAMGFILDSRPIDLFNDHFNIYRMNFISPESGISVAGGVQRDNYFGSYRNKDGLAHYTGFDDEKRDELEDTLKKMFEKKVYVVMILNDTRYGGSGEFVADNKIMTVVQAMYNTQHGLFRELILHEFGHSFGDLADEYGGNCNDADRPDDWDAQLYNRKNVTYDAVNDRKWDFLADPQYILGANYCDDEWYRSSATGLMRDLTSGIEHNELGLILMEERILEDKEYNEHLTSFIKDDESSEVFDQDDHLRIHADWVTLSKPLTCDTLFVSKGSTLEVPDSENINCNMVTNLGTIVSSAVHSKKTSTLYVRFGCKDLRAKNYNHFSRHQQSLCAYSLR